MGYLDLNYVPVLFLLMQVGKDLGEGLILPLGHQTCEALTGLEAFRFLLH